MKPLISGGYILLARKIEYSEIMRKPPLYLKVWVWLVLMAKYSPKTGLLRGQLKTSIREIQEAMSYWVGYRKTAPSKKEIWGILEWLRSPREGDAKGTMIVTTKVTSGIVISIENYDYYQNSANYEGNGEGNNEEDAKVTTGEQQDKKERKERKKEIETHTSSDVVDDASERCPHSEIIALYHGILPELPKIKEWTPSRQVLLRTRWNEKAERRNLEWWESFFRGVKESDFLCGRAKEFRADLEWLVRPKNFPKVIEGRYVNSNQSSSSDSEPEDVKAARRRLACQKMNS